MTHQVQIQNQKTPALTSSKASFEGEIEVGQRVKIDTSIVRGSFPKDRTGQLSPAALRMVATFEMIVDATGFRPFVTEVRVDEIEIATSYFGEGMKTLRIPRRAVVAVVASHNIKA